MVTWWQNCGLCPMSTMLVVIGTIEERSLKKGDEVK
jgi:hypothetical protein